MLCALGNLPFPTCGRRPCRTSLRFLHSVKQSGKYPAVMIPPDLRVPPPPADHPGLTRPRERLRAVLKTLTPTASQLGRKQGEGQVAWPQDGGQGGLLPKQTAGHRPSAPPPLAGQPQDNRGESCGSFTWSGGPDSLLQRESEDRPRSGHCIVNSASFPGRGLPQAVPGLMCLCLTHPHGRPAAERMDGRTGTRDNWPAGLQDWGGSAPPSSPLAPRGLQAAATEDEKQETRPLLQSYGQLRVSGAPQAALEQDVISESGGTGISITVRMAAEPQPAPAAPLPGPTHPLHLSPAPWLRLNTWALSSGPLQR